MAGKSRTPVLIIASVLVLALAAAAVIAFMALRDPFKVLEAGGRPGWAVKKLQDLALSNPDDFRVQSWLVRLDLEAGRSELASSRLDMLKIKAPNNYFTYRATCVYNLKIGNFPPAEAACGRALELSPSRTTEDVNLAASAYLKTGRLETALPLLQELMKKLPDDAQVINNMGYYYMKHSRNEEARDLFLKALKLDPGMVTARRNLARTCLSLGKYQESVETYKSVLETKPADIESLSMLASIYARQFKDGKNAKYYYDLAVKNGLDKTQGSSLRSAVLDAQLMGKSSGSQSVPPPH